MVSGNRYLPRGSNENTLCITSTGNVSVAGMVIPVVTRESHLGKTQLMFFPKKTLETCYDVLQNSLLLKLGIVILCPKYYMTFFMELFTTMVQRGIRFVSDYFPLFAAHLERYPQLTNQAFCYKIGTKCIGYMLCQMLISYKFQIVIIHQVEWLTNMNNYIPKIVSKSFSFFLYLSNY